jgi:membrane protein
VFGIGLLVVATLGVVVQLRDALNSIFEIKEPDAAGVTWYARAYALSFAGILVLGFLLPTALVVNAGLDSDAQSVLLTVTNFIISLAVLTEAALVA